MTIHYFSHQLFILLAICCMSDFVQADVREWRKALRPTAALMGLGSNLIPCTLSCYARIRFGGRESSTTVSWQWWSFIWLLDPTEICLGREIRIHCSGHQCLQMYLVVWAFMYTDTWYVNILWWQNQNHANTTKYSATAGGLEIRLHSSALVVMEHPIIILLARLVRCTMKMVCVIWWSRSYRWRWLR